MKSRSTIHSYEVITSKTSFHSRAVSNCMMITRGFPLGKNISEHSILPISGFDAVIIRRGWLKDLLVRGLRFLRRCNIHKSFILETGILIGGGINVAYCRADASTISPTELLHRYTIE
jgi:hypothetical protein